MSRAMLFTACVCVTLSAMPRPVCANPFAVGAGPFVDHPVHHPLSGRTSSVWRRGVSSWGEKFVEDTLHLRGFNEVYEFKWGSNNGIDRIAIKRASDGRIIDVKFVEVKTSRSAKPKLGNTRYGGTQMSREWLTKNLRIMRNSGDPAFKKLAVEISRFRRASGMRIESLGEVVHVNPKTGTMTGYTADVRSVKYSESIERLLKKIQTKGRTQHARRLATRTLSQWDQIRTTSMSRWLGTSASQQSRRSLISNSGRRLIHPRSGLPRESSRAVTTRLLQRSAGRIAVVVALVMDAKELFDNEAAYRRGDISVRRRNVQLISSLGGMGGAFVGASGGAWMGAWVGGFGGPIAWITVPAGGFIGAVIGGVGGYWGGSTAAGYGATVWYDSIDASVREKFELGWLGGESV